MSESISDCRLSLAVERVTLHATGDPGGVFTSAFAGSTSHGLGLRLDEYCTWTVLGALMKAWVLLTLTRAFASSKSSGRFDCSSPRCSNHCRCGTSLGRRCCDHAFGPSSGLCLCLHTQCDTQHEVKTAIHYLLTLTAAALAPATTGTGTLGGLPHDRPWREPGMLGLGQIKGATCSFKKSAVIVNAASFTLKPGSWRNTHSSHSLRQTSNT